MRRVTVWVILLALLMVAPLPAAETGSDAAVVQPIQALTGEDYRYRIDFLFFNHLAEGTLRLLPTEQPSVYRAELIGRTLGIASWLAGDRTQTYRSTMQLMPNGVLRSLQHTSHIRKRRWGHWQNRTKIRRFDYQAREIFEQKLNGAVVMSESVHKMPPGQDPVDILTAFYNLRLGAYGELRRGRTLLIPTYSGKGFVPIEVVVMTERDQAAHGFFPNHGLLLEASIDPEVFDTNSGHLYIWFDRQGIPDRGVIEDLIGLGDVRGTRERKAP
jgi:hypothetical protein